MKCYEGRLLRWLLGHEWVVLRRRYAVVKVAWVGVGDDYKRPYDYDAAKPETVSEADAWKATIKGRDPCAVIEYRHCSACGEAERRTRCETPGEYRTRLARIDTGETVGVEVEGS